MSTVKFLRMAIQSPYNLGYSPGEEAEIDDELAVELEEKGYLKILDNDRIFVSGSGSGPMTGILQYVDETPSDPVLPPPFIPNSTGDVPPFIPNSTGDVPPSIPNSTGDVPHGLRADTGGEQHVLIATKKGKK